MSRDSLPDFHFLFIVPNLGAEYFFDAAFLYWARFQPTVISDFELLRLIPEQFTVSVTAIVRRDTAEMFGVELAQIKADALYDPLVYDFFDDLKLALDQRAELNQPFGVPLAPTPTPTTAPTAETINPTPGAIQLGTPLPTPTRRAAGGFITQTPTPSPTGLAAQTDDSQTPIQPTPGPIVDGAS